MLKENNAFLFVVNVNVHFGRVYSQIQLHREPWMAITFDQTEKFFVNSRTESMNRTIPSTICQFVCSPAKEHLTELRIVSLTTHDHYTCIRTSCNCDVLCAK